MADYINSVDLLDHLGFVVDDTSGFLDGPTVGRELVRVVRSPGGRVRSERLNERIFEVNGYITQATLADAVAYVGKLKALALRGVGSTVEIELGLKAGWYVKGSYLSFTEQTERPSHTRRQRGVKMQFLVSDPPAFISRTLTTVGSITTSPKSLPMGSAPPVDAVLKLYQPTDPVITLKDHNGDLVGDPMEFSFSYVLGEYLVIDLQRREIYRNNTGEPRVGTECSETFVAGDFLDLEDWLNWDTITDAYATVQLNSGGGTGTMTYYKSEF